MSFTTQYRKISILSKTNADDDRTFFIVKILVSYTDMTHREIREKFLEFFKSKGPAYA